MFDRPVTLHRSPRRADTAHHHPHVEQDLFRGWVWSCPCGGHSPRACSSRPTWHQMVIEALAHSDRLAA